MTTTPPPAWQVRHAPLPHAVLHGAPPLTPLQVQLFTQRGVAEPAEMLRWYTADPSLIGDPALLPDIERAIARLRQAISNAELIGIVGDCDVDGLTATAIAIEALRAAGAREPRRYIAPRDDDGRGLTLATAAKLRADGVQVCLTVDNGSSSVAEVALLHAAGIDTIITDHHHLPENLPAAYALVNPQRADGQYPHRAIAGAGVALHLARALLGVADLADERIAPLVELAGLGTLADVVELGPENHALVRRALAQMSAAPRPGIAACMDLLRIDPRLIGPRDVSFAIAPRLNAAGRLGDPLVALDLLLSREPAEARALARKLDDLNVTRQRQTETMYAVARALAQEQVAQGEPIIFVQQDDWPLGLVGLVAGRLAGDFDRLAVVAAIQGDRCRASLRGPRWFHIAAALAACDPPLAEAGGHAQAGGFGTTPARLPAIRAQLAAAYRAAQLARAEEPQTILSVDAVLPLNRVTREYVEQLRQLAPFGAGFAEPLFVTQSARIIRTWAVNEHLKFVAERRGDRRTFFWRQGARSGGLLPDQIVDIAWHMPLSLYPSAEPEPIVAGIFPHADA